MNVESSDNAAIPPWREMGTEIVRLDRNDHFFEQRTQQLLLVTIRGGGCGPYTIEVAPLV
jgi:hypothetical protein